MIFKNTKTGKLDQISVSQIESCKWIRIGNRPGIKIIEKDGNVHRYGGFAPEVTTVMQQNFVLKPVLNFKCKFMLKDFEKMKNFTKNNWDINLISEDQCVKGWNYGTAEFEG